MNFWFVIIIEIKGKTLQKGKGAVGHVEKLVKVGPRPSKRDLAHVVVMMHKHSTHAQKGNTSDVSIHEHVVDENRPGT